MSSTQQTSGAGRPRTGQKPPATNGTARQRPAPTPAMPGPQPAAGRHVPSNVPGHQVYDCSGAVGSNVTPAGPGVPAAASDEVLSAPPWQAAYPTPGLDQQPMY